MCPASGLTVGARLTACPNSRRAKAASVHSVGASTGVLGASLANGDSALTTVDAMSDTTLAGVGAEPEEDLGAVAALVTAENTAALVVVAAEATDGVVDADRRTPCATTRSASTLMVGPAPGAGTDAKADAPVSFPDALPDPADDHGPRR